MLKTILRGRYKEGKPRNYASRVRLAGGEIADSLKSLAVNNGLPRARQSVGVDGSSAGQALQTSYVGLKSQRFGTLTFGRQVTPLLEGIIKYDPNYNASAVGLLGASNAYSGGGSRSDPEFHYVPVKRHGEGGVPARPSRW